MENSIYALYVFRERGNISVYTQGIRPTFFILTGVTGFRIERRTYTAEGCETTDLAHSFVLAQRAIKRWLERRHRIRRIARPSWILRREVGGLNLKLIGEL